MKITLDKDELSTAVIAYLQSCGLSLDANKASIHIDQHGVKIDTSPKNKTDKPTHKTKPNKPEPKPAKPTTQTPDEVVVDTDIGTDTDDVDTDEAVAEVSDQVSTSLDEPKSAKGLFHTHAQSDTDATQPLPTTFGSSTEQVRKLFA